MMRRIFALMMALCMLCGAALAEPCIAKDGTCPQVVAPTRVFVPAEGESTGDIADSIMPVASKVSMLPWKGAIVVGTLPKDAEIVETLQDDFGYAQTLSYDGRVSIVTGRFGSVEARDAFVLENFMPAGEYAILNDAAGMPGTNALHIRYARGEGGDAEIVDAYYFSDPENFFLFLTAIDADAYDGEGAEFAYGEFVPDWVASLGIVTL